MENGVKFDKGKMMFSLLPISAVNAVVDVLMFGMKKYSRNNWKKGIAFSRLVDAIYRHIFVEWVGKGKEEDYESGIHPLAHAACDILMLLYYCLNYDRYREFDDRIDNLK